MVRKLSFLIYYFSLSCIIVWFAYGEPMPELGARAVGLGGAFVAVGDDMSSSHWNPASTSKFGGFGTQVTIGNGIDFTGNMLDSLESLANMSTFENIEQSTPSLQMILDYAKLIEGLDGMTEPGTGILTQIPGGIAICFDRITIAANTFTSIGINPDIDLVNIGYGASSINSLSSSFRNTRRIMTDTSFTTVDISTDAPDGDLLDERDSIASFIDTLIQEGGVDFGEDFQDLDPEQIANAFIYGALEDGATPEQIEEIAGSLENLEHLIGIILGGSGGSFENNQSNVVVKGLSVAEVIIGYSMPCEFLDESFLKGLSFGLNLKYQYGYTFYQKIHMSSGIAESVSEDDVINSNTFSVDVGLLLDKKEEFGMRFGIVMKNINAPKFDVSDNAIADGIEYYELAPQIRVGFAFYPVYFLGIAADMDLTENETLIDGYKSKMASVGAEFNLIPPGGASVFNIAMRVGAKCNLAMVDDLDQAIEENRLIFTAGIGANLATVGVDLACSFNNDMTYVDRDSLTEILGEDILNQIEEYAPIEGIPPGVQIALTVSIRFGGPKKTKKGLEEFYEDEEEYFYDYYPPPRPRRDPSYY